MDNYIAYEELEIEMEKIKSNITDFQSFLDTIENTISEVETTNSTFKGLNFSQIGKGEPVADAATALATSLMNLHILVKRVFIKESSIDSYCASSESEIDNMRDRLSSILSGINSAEESLKVIAFYLSQAQIIFNQENPESEISFWEQFHEATNLMMNDAANGYTTLHSTPILMNGDVNMRIGQSVDDPNRVYRGRYLQFYNEYGIEVIAPMAYISLDAYRAYTDEELNENIPIYTEYYNRIMDNINNRYTAFHRNSLGENINQIIFEDSYYMDRNDNSGQRIERDNDGITFTDSNNQSNINMPIRPLLDNPNDNDQWEYAVDSFNRQSGHALDNYIGCTMGPFSEMNAEYAIYYNLLEGTDTINNGDSIGIGGLRNHAFESPRELFAESVAEYYGNGTGAYAHYSPDDLRATQVQISSSYVGNLVMSSYEIMSNILNGGGFYGDWA